MKVIPQDICDLDFYTISMGQMIFNQFPNTYVRYKYFNRDPKKTFTQDFVNKLQNQVNQLGKLTMNPSMIEFLHSKASWLKPTYLQWLSCCFQFKPENVKISLVNGKLDIEIEGLWFESIFWEEPLLYIISELESEESNLKENKEEEIFKVAKQLFENEVSWVEFGTRRRFSSFIQDKVCEICKPFSPFFRGTSNPYFAQKHKIPVFGTFAHQLPMAMQALYGIEQCNVMAMEHWVKEYRGDLGIALTDTITTDHFLKTFDSYYARLFDGVRQDSGDPIEIGEKIITHYQKLRIDPMSKVLVFSDSLDLEKAIKINQHFKNRIKTTMGIGTFLTNKIVRKAGKPLNQVIKLTSLDFGSGFKDIVKISDDIGKITGNEELVKIAKYYIK